ncbi:MAG: hypothetical protein Q9178_005658 [Gyalolechia marmorata]
MPPKTPATKPAVKAPAKPQAKPAASKPVRTKYSAKGALLSYVDDPSKDVRDPKNWITLEAQPGYKDGNNVGIVEFEGMIHITQKTKDVKCILDFTTANYSNVRVMKGKKPSDRITISYSVLGKVGIRYEPDIAGAHIRRRKALEVAAKANGWVGVKILTADAIADVPAKSAALIALHQRYEEAVDRTYDEALAAQEPLDFQIAALSVTRSEAKPKADQDNLHKEIVELDEALRERQGECDRAIQDLEKEYERKKQELAAVEESNDDDLYNAD